jgi:hypothetical protein
MGGSPWWTLDWTEMPAHSHNGGTDYNGDHEHYYQHAYSQGAGQYFQGGPEWQVGTYDDLTTTNGGHYHNVWVDAQGGGAAHPNMQVTAVIMWIMRVY